MPHHISVRSTKPPKVTIYPQRPEQTRKGRIYDTTRHQPDVRVIPNRQKPTWKYGFHDNQLNYPKYLEKKHGPTIGKFINIFGCKFIKELLRRLCL